MTSCPFCMFNLRVQLACSSSMFILHITTPATLSQSCHGKLVCLSNVDICFPSWYSVDICFPSWYSADICLPSWYSADTCFPF